MRSTEEEGRAENENKEKTDKEKLEETSKQI